MSGKYLNLGKLGITSLQDKNLNLGIKKCHLKHVSLTKGYLHTNKCERW